MINVSKESAFFTYNGRLPQIISAGLFTTVCNIYFQLKCMLELTHLIIFAGTYKTLLGLL